jgi:two-component system sensor histidine kinase KdpD
MRRDPLLAAICHDLRAPLAAVTMGANFVLQTTPEDESAARQRKILEAMLRSCAQMERLVRNFGDLSEIDGGAVALRPAEVDARELAQIAVEHAQGVAQTKKVSLVADVPDERVPISADRDRLLRALAHLVDNALRVAPPETVVVVGVKKEDDGVAISVSDEGPGLPTAMKKNLFDREWHAKNSGRAGSGFGLAIVKGFTDAHGGHVDVTSKKGATTIAIVLPTPKEVSRPRSRRR